MEKPLFLDTVVSYLGCLPFVCTHAVRGVHVCFFPSIFLCFCSNVFGFFTFVANLTVFRAIFSIFFLFYGLICCWIPLDFKFNFSFSRANARLVFTAALDRWGLSKVEDCLTKVGSGIPCLNVISSSDHFWSSCLISDGIEGWSRFFRSKQACLVFSQLKLFGELFVLQKGVIFVTPCGVIRSVLIISATSDANLNGVFFESIFMTPSRRLSVFISRFTTPMDLWSSTGENRSFTWFDLQKSWNFLAGYVCAWSHLNLRGTPLLEMQRCINFGAMSAVVFETT